MIFVFNYGQLVLLTAFVLSVQSLSNDGDQLVKLFTDASAIFPSPNVRSTLGIVGGVKSCGGPAEVLEWRYEGCNGSAVCQSPGDGAKRRGEYTLVLSETIPGGLGVRYNLTGEGFPDLTYDFLLPDSAVKGGETYTIVAYGSGKESFKGKIVNFQFIVFRQVDNFVEACSEAVFEIV